MTTTWISPTREQVDGMIAEMVRRLVAGFRPEKVILFGSHGRGDAAPDSDVDLLVVMPFTGRKLDRIVDLRLALDEVPISKDVFLMTPEDYEADRDLVGTLAYPAAHEGKILYERP